MKELILRNKTRIGGFLLACYLSALVDKQIVAFLSDHLWINTLINIFNGGLIASGMTIKSDTYHRTVKILKDIEQDELDNNK